VSQEYFGSAQRVRPEDSINILFVLFFALIGIPFPDFFFELYIIIGRKRSPKSHNAKSHLKNKLLLVDIENIRRNMAFAVKVSLRIMVSRDENDLALEEVMQKQQNFITSRQLFLLRVRPVVMVAIDDVSSHEAVVKVQRVGSDVLC
jgi:hypothetical protein